MRRRAATICDGEIVECGRRQRCRTFMNGVPVRSIVHTTDQGGVGLLTVVAGDVMEIWEECR